MKRKFERILTCIALLVGLALLMPLASNAQVNPPPGQRLRDLAGSFHIGAESDDNFWTLPDTTTYQQVLGSEFNMVTPGNQLKFDTTEPQQNVFNFVPGDMHFQFANQHGMLFHGHVLVWHNQIASWVTNHNPPFNASQLTGVMTNHIDNVVGHYVGKVAVWDVVNEAFNEDGTRRASIWETTIGDSYIETAFRRARAADNTVMLVYNDFNIEPLGAKSNAVFAMVQDFKSRGVPIDAVGFQMHLTSGGIDINSLKQNMQRFANLGVKILITEMDVRYVKPISASDAQAQATIYQNVLNACLSQPACFSLQTWGFTDKYSWIDNTFPPNGDALPFDRNYAAKPAYFAMQTALGALSGGAPTVSITAPANGATFTAPANITISANATASSGRTITSVAFLANGTQIGSDAASPFTFNWTNVAAGNYSLTAIATDNTGATGTSAPVSITVNPAAQPGFTLSANPASVTVNRGSTATSTVNIARTGGFTGSVTFSASGLPTGVTASFNPASATGNSSVITFAASATAALGTSTVTITGTATGLSPVTTTISLTVANGSNTGGVTVTPVVASQSNFFNEEQVKIANTGSLTAMTVTVVIQRTTGISFSGQYNTVGGQISMTHTSTTSTVTYTFTLNAGQTLSPGTNWIFASQTSGTGTAHPTAGDTFTVTYTTGGQNFTQTGHF